MPWIFIVILVAAAVLLFRQIVMAGGFNSYKTMFSREYASVIQNSFQSDKKGEKKLYRAVFFYNKKQYEEAIRLLQALETWPGAGNTEKGAIYFFEAICSEMAGRKDEAVGLYEKAVNANPGIDRGWSNLGLLYQEKGENQKAYDAYRKAIEGNPENPYPYNNMAHLLLKEEKPEEAIPYALKAYELRDWLYQAAMALAIAYARTGQPELAQQYYDRCAELGRCDLEKLRAKMNG